MQFSVDILGSCVLRDAFEFSEPLIESCNVNKFVQSNSPISLNSARLSEVEEVRFSLNDFKKTNPVWYKWFMLNAEEGVYPYLSDKKSHFLILTLIENTYGYHEIKSGTLEARLCQSMAISKNNIFAKFKQKPKYIHFSKYNNTKVEASITEHLSKLKDIYKEENIIFIDFLPAHKYIKNGKIETYTDDKYYSDLAKSINSYNNQFYKLCPTSPVIKLPDNILGDPDHRWGLGAQHYIKPVYDYIGKSIYDIIFDKPDNSNEDFSQLQSHCEKIVNMYSEKK